MDDKKGRQVMIETERFIVPSSLEREWKKVRQTAVTATMVAKAATPAGLKEVLDGIGESDEIPDNAYMKFGRDNEAWIVHAIKSQGVLSNNYLIRSAQYDWAMATPDGLSVDHNRIAEVKTTGTDWGEWSKVPIAYRRQVQWQLFVTGATDCVFAWMLREESSSGEFVPAWFEPKSVIVDRDEVMIAKLVDVGLRIYDEIQKKGK